MEQERIEIKLSKVKGILTFLGSVAFVVFSIWLINYADTHETVNILFFELDPASVTVMSYVGLAFFGLVGLYIFYKLFDSKPGLIIDKDGIHDNSNASSAHLIKWEQIKGLKIKKVMSTKFILIDIHTPEDFMQNFSGIKKKLMQGNYRMYGTPISIISNSLNCNTEYLFTTIKKRMILEHKNNIE